MISQPYPSPMRHLPPLAAVRVFEAAARHENFTAAAVELGMTQAAVSYQIRLLEERLGLPLFRRERRRVLLTEAGRRAASQLTAAFDAIDAAFAGVRAEDEAVLTVSTTNTFANLWLAWRLGGFQLAHPDTAVRMLTDNRLANFATEDVDVAIRSGTGDWPGLAAHRLMTLDFTPMCSPAFLAEQGGAIELADLLQLPLISAHDPWWATWLRDAGLDVIAARRTGIRLDSQAHEGRAAIAGQGVAMLTPLFWQNDLAAGRLVQPFAHVGTDSSAYWLVYPEARAKVVKIKRFREWLLATLGDSAG
ncbi:transcriptional regulator GcvA [Sphingomonas sp. 8AM]|uniref:transcriptional regulator GcvA n=1 Tax=Sphingomonas sp. 8AM TaxID=2653170 RepID=UPI0012F32A41|nr:transcriptional regulator GcvA [Sphingomonas sp. 8AM]VXC98638.1 Glycine cleavage system transcriptional activator [Sphingomonas sp. 8AM]